MIGIHLGSIPLPFCGFVLFNGYTQGLFSYRDYDLGNSKCVVFWGTDPFASNRQVPNVISRLGTLQKNGTLITVDPRLSTAAAKSKEWLPLLPGTDGALANAIAHVLLTEGLWNKEFVGVFVDSKNQFIAGKTVKPEAFKENNTPGPIQTMTLGAALPSVLATLRICSGSSLHSLPAFSGVQSFASSFQ